MTIFLILLSIYLFVSIIMAVRSDGSRAVSKKEEIFLCFLWPFFFALFGVMLIYSTFRKFMTSIGM